MDDEDRQEFNVVGKNVRTNETFSALGSTKQDLERRKAEITPGMHFERLIMKRWRLGLLGLEMEMWSWGWWCLRH